jgi:dephospho-CoA kinase
MLRVGLTGGLATGKSFVGDSLAALGCRVLKADELGHQALLPGGGAFERVVELFGPSILDEEGRIVRRRLAAEVFNKPERLALLNELVHPVVIAQEEEWFRSIEQTDPSAICVVEAAILIETGSYRRFHKLILTVCPPEVQVERAMKRDKFTRDEVIERLQRQMSLEEKRSYADYIVDTSGDKAATLEQVRRVYQSLRRLVP